MATNPRNVHYKIATSTKIGDQIAIADNSIDARTIWGSSPLVVYTKLECAMLKKYEINSDTLKVIYNIKKMFNGEIEEIIQISEIPPDEI